MGAEEWVQGPRLLMSNFHTARLASLCCHNDSAAGSLSLVILLWAAYWLREPQSVTDHNHNKPPIFQVIQLPSEMLRTELWCQLMASRHASGGKQKINRGWGEQCGGCWFVVVWPTLATVGIYFRVKCNNPKDVLEEAQFITKTVKLKWII